MIGIALVAALAMQTGDSPIVLGNQYGGEVLLLQRFADMTGRKGKVAIALSMTVTALFRCPATERRALLESFAAEFGVDFRRVTNRGELILPFPKFVISNTKGLGLASFVRLLGGRSLLAKAVADAMHGGRVGSRATWVSCSYVIRPWVTAELKRTERLSGMLVVLSPKGRARTLLLESSP